MFGAPLGVVLFLPIRARLLPLLGNMASRQVVCLALQGAVLLTVGALVRCGLQGCVGGGHMSFFVFSVLPAFKNKPKSRRFPPPPAMQTLILFLGKLCSLTRCECAGERSTGDCGVDPTFGCGSARRITPIYPKRPGAVTKGEPPLVTIGFLRTFPNERGENYDRAREVKVN